MKHYGDITKLSGYTLPVVDVITGGSPCQDLSVAGKRAGLEGERSGLFMEQIRIVREMRERDRTENGRTGYLIRPRFMVWENVPGAFSSNKGADFQAVLTEIVRIAEPNAPIVPMPDKAKWSKSGCLYDSVGGWSVAWRVHDAQFWGVPQRRKRIALVADFGGLSAPEICFERKGLRWDSDESEKEGKEASGRIGEGTEETGGMTISFQERAGKPGGGKGILIQEEHVGALSTLNIQKVLDYKPKTVCIEGNGARESHRGDGYKESDVMYTLNTAEQHAVAYGISSYDSNAMKSANPHSGIYEAETARTLDMNGGSPACNQGGIAIVQDEKLMCLNDQGGSVMDVSEDVTATLRAENHGHVPKIVDKNVYDGSRRHNYESFGEVSETVQAQYGTGGNNTPLVVEPIVYGQKGFADYEEKVGTLRAAGCDYGGGSENLCVQKVREEPTMIEMTSTKNTVVEDGISPTLTARMGTGGNQVNALCMDVGFFQTNEEKTGALLARQYKDPPITYQDKTGSLMASVYNKLGTQEAANDMYVTGAMVRRLTPLECERLQGFPDGWTDIGEWIDTKGKKHKDADSPRYKALGNSIALPFWKYLARRICAQYERKITMGSLFDGIGGFPYAFERCGAKAVWASEIEEFPIAVTKLRFPEE